MRLKVLLPTGILLDRQAVKITADTKSGSWGIRERHVDFVTMLVPGLLSFVPEGGGEEEYVALDEGILVKKGDEVLVSARSGVAGRRLGELREAVDELFHNRSEQEKKTQSVLARLESDFARRFVRMNE